MEGSRDPEAKFNTRDRKRLEIWDEIQRVQTDFCFAQEVSAYYMSRNWVSDVGSVLDVGTGNGYFLNKLMGLFPEKRYTGIDLSQDFIELARCNIRSFPVELKVQDYFAATGIYDFVIMRLFWQHLPQSRLAEALNKLKEITRPGSSVLISDAYDQARCFVPALPEFEKVILAYTEQQRGAERNRDVLADLLRKLHTDSSWRVGLDLSLIMPSTLPGYGELYGRTYQLWIELFECLGELKIDFAPAREELMRWRNDRKHKFTQAGLRVIRLDRLS